jgi:hypothetical protein
MIFSADSTIRFSVERGFSETFYILCPVCWNAGIKVIRWEDGSYEESECAVCKRREESMT